MSRRFQPAFPGLRQYPRQAGWLLRKLDPMTIAPSRHFKNNLLVDRHFAIAGNPESHGASS